MSPNTEQPANCAVTLRDKSNFKEWRLVTIACAMSQGVPCRFFSEDDPLPDHADERRYNEILYATIVKSLRGRALETIQRIKLGDGRAILQELDRVYDRKSTHAKFTAYKKMFLAKCDSWDKLEEYLSQVLELEDQIRRNLDVKDLLPAVILAGVSHIPLFQASVSVFMTLEEPSVDVLISNLREAAERVTTEVPPEEVHKVSEEICCSFCGKRGHSKLQCFKRKRQERERQEVTFMLKKSHGQSYGVHDSFCLDSGSSTHICCNKKFFIPPLEVCHVVLSTASGAEVVSHEKGRIAMDVSGTKIYVNDVLYSPDVSNILSMSNMARNGVQFEFKNMGNHLAVKKGEFEVFVKQNRGQYHLRAQPLYPQLDSITARAQPFYLQSDSTTASAQPFYPQSYSDSTNVRAQPRRQHQSRDQSFLQQSDSTTARENTKFARRNRAQPSASHSGTTMARENANLLVAYDRHEVYAHLERSATECEECILAKTRRKKIARKTGTNRAKSCFQVIHLDLAHVNSPSTYKYFAVFIDDYSRYTWTVPLMKKSEAIKGLDQLEEFGHVGQGIIKSDQAPEFAQGPFIARARSLGYRLEMSPTYEPSLNGTAERCIGILKSALRAALLTVSRLAGTRSVISEEIKLLWPYALEHVVFLKNHIKNETTGRFPICDVRDDVDLKHLEPLIFPFGALVKFAKTEPILNTFENRGEFGLFLGSSAPSGSFMNSFRIADKQGRIRNTRSVSSVPEDLYQKEAMLSGLIKTFTATLKIDVLLPTIFRKPRGRPKKGQFWSASRGIWTSNPEEAPEIRKSEDAPDSEDFLETDESGSQNESPAREDRGNDISPNLGRKRPRSEDSDLSESDDELVIKRATHEVNQLCVKNSEALNGEEKMEWIEAIEREVTSLYEHEVVKEVFGKFNELIPAILILSTKTDPDRKKCRIVVLGDRMKDTGNQNYASVVEKVSLRTIITTSLDQYDDLSFAYVDIPTAFLKSQVPPETPDVYVLPPKWLEDLSLIRRGTIWMCKPTLYGFREAPRLWKDSFTRKLADLKVGNPLMSDPNVFQTSRGYLTLHVDDVLSIGKGSSRCLDAIARAYKATPVTVPRTGHFKYLGLMFEVGENFVSISSKEKIIQLLKKAGLEEANPSKSLPEVSMLKKEKLADDIALNETETKKFQEFVGGLNYIASESRPDISAVVFLLSEVMLNPVRRHEQAVKSLLRYLKGTVDLKLYWEKSKQEGINVDLYTDSSFDTGCISGMILRINQKTIGWKTCREPHIALSTVESEFDSAVSAVRTTRFVLELLKEMNLGPCKKTLYVDQTGAKEILASNKGRIKHVDLQREYLRREFLDWKIVRITSGEQLADLMTKPLGSKRLALLRDQIGLKF